MKKIISLFLAALLLFSLAACQKNEPSDTTPPSDVVDKTLDQSEDETPPEHSTELSGEDESLPAVSVLIDTITQTHSDDESGQTLLYVEYPSISVTGPENVANKINSVIEQQMSAFEEEMETIKDVAAEDYLFAPEDWIEYGYYRSASVPHLDTAALSIIFSDSRQTGGMHPNASHFTLCFDLETGKELTLASLSNDPEAFLEAVKEYILSDISARWSPEYFYPGYENGIDLFVTDRCWYFSDDGLVFICAPYVIAPYAMGTLEFTVPYTELSGLISDKWIPAVTGGETTEDMMQIAAQNDVDLSTFERVDSLILEERGQKLALFPSESVTNIHIESITYVEGYDFITNSTLYASNIMEPTDALIISAVIPEGAPNLSVSYTTAGGSVVTRLISQSGADGSFLLIAE